MRGFEELQSAVFNEWNIPPAQFDFQRIAVMGRSKQNRLFSQRDPGFMMFQHAFDDVIALLILVDQRINMFFGSRRSMKSVVAAEVAALAAWRVFSEGDRVGALVFNDTSIDEIRMHRSRATVLRILDRLTTRNKQLRSDQEEPAAPQKLNEVLDKVARICHHDALILIASDFDGADEVGDALGDGGVNGVLGDVTLDAHVIGVSIAR